MMHEPSGPVPCRALAAVVGAALALAACGTQAASDEPPTAPATRAGALPGTASSSPAAASSVPTTSASDGDPAASAVTTASEAPSGSGTSPGAPASGGVSSGGSSDAEVTPGGATPGTGHNGTPQGLTALYLVGEDGDAPGESGAARNRLRLFRVFVPVAQGAAAGSSADQGATRAVAAVMTAAPPGYLRLWGERSVQGVTRSGGTIVVTLDGPGPATTPERARAAVDSIVWTVTAAYGADEPVRFVVPGASTVIGTLPTSQTYRRAQGADQAGVLAGLWIDEPSLGATVPAGRVVAKGQASVHEASVEWSLTRDGAAAGTGVTTATVAAPERGAWSLDLGSLTAGRYVLTVWSQSMADAGGAVARTVHPFTVR